MLLNRGMRGLPLYRALFYLPSLLGASVAIAILWRQIFARDGLVNDFLAIFGIVGPELDLDAAIFAVDASSSWPSGSSARR